MAEGRRLLTGGEAAGTTEGEEEAAVTGGGGAAVVGAVPGGGVGTEGATSSVDAVGYRCGRRRVLCWCGQRGWCPLLPLAAVWAPPPSKAAIPAQMRRRHRRRTEVRNSMSSNETKMNKVILTS